MYNKTLLNANGIKSYEDPANPRLKGKLCVRLGGHVYNLSLMSALIEHWGEPKAEQWAKGVVANFARAPKGGDTDQLKAVAAGKLGGFVTRLVGRALDSDPAIRQSLDEVHQVLATIAGLARRHGLPYRSSNASASNAADAQGAYEMQMSLWGAVLGGGRINMQKAAEVLLYDLRRGQLGRITLETPEEFAAWTAQAAAELEARRRRDQECRVERSRRRPEDRRDRRHRAKPASPRRIP